MNRFLHHAAFACGLAALGWVGAGYIGHNPLALAITALIAAFYLMGALELHRFRQATATLAQALADIPEPLPGLRPWLDRLHPSLQNTVRRRIEGEPAGLPGPAMAPYLAGLLVILGMLGTFLGMVLTLRGTGTALQSATDLQAVRMSLVAPVQGLGLAFGTSVAGVATSAALGLLSALSRRERLQVAQALDTKIATTLRVFSLTHQREESLKLLQRQAELMPALVDGLQAMMQAMEKQAEASNARLLASQETFHGRAEAAFVALASSVDRTLKQSLTDSARIAGATIAPAVEATMAGITRETAALHAALGDTVQRQLAELSTRFEGSATRVADTFGQQSTALLRTVEQAHADLHAASTAREQQRLAAMTQAMEAMAGTLQREWQQAGAQTLAQQLQIGETMERTARDITAQAEAQAKATAGEIARVLQVAAEAPRAAADVIVELRQKLSDSMARDNTLLDERARMLETLGTLLDAVHQASTEQRGAIDAMVGQSAALLDRVGERFSEQVDMQADKLATVAAQVTGSAVEVASLGDAFGVAVQLFSTSNDKLVAQLERIDGALAKSMARSDEQLAYYVAQAREVIDLSILSQKQIIEDLQRHSGKAAAAPVAVAAAAAATAR